MPELPKLDAEFIFPISIFILNVLLALFRFILMTAVGACFAIYSKYGDAYAHSVRWIRNAGFLQMIHTLRHTHKNVSRSARVALVVAFFATVVASFLDKGIAHFIKPAPYIDQSNSRTSIHTTAQSAPKYHYKLFAGWTIAHAMNANITGTMTRMLNGSVAIPNAVSGEVYTPVTSAYTVQCTRFSVSFGGLGLTNDGCAKLHVEFLGNSSGGIASVPSESAGRWSILLSSGSEPYSIRTTPMNSWLNLNGPLSSEESYCAGLESFRMRPFGGAGAADHQNTDYGVTSFPTTTTTKCIHDTSDITVNTMTSTRFTFSDGVFDVLKAKELFADQSDDLLQSMQETFKNKTIAPSNTPVELWAEVRVMNASVDALACSLDRFDSLYGQVKKQMLECVYVNINVMVVKQPLNSNIQGKLAKGVFLKPFYSTYMTMEYVMGIDNGKTSPISLARLSSDVVEVNHYMARLGSNYYADFDEEKLYVEYNISDMKLGYKVPFWILLLIGVLLVAGLSVWLVSTLVGSPYNSSLYSILTKQVPTEGDNSSSRLVEVKFKPLTFDGIPVLPNGNNPGASGPSSSEKKAA
ncbi:MAG: hypothetical protein J3Q66DRAFT_386359 [Benniella sp.]|nr:MAG: hypothetical protein J3Q66DRAFT_386359 [Benniella sp.]